MDTTATAESAPDTSAPKRSWITYNPNRVAHTLNKLGLGYFSPFVRLIGRDEPAKQIREIAQNTLLPVTAFLGFIILWSIFSSVIKTDSVQIPSPHQSWYALTGTTILGFSHPFPESINGEEAPYFSENSGLDPKSINGFAQAEKFAEKNYLNSQQERIDSYLGKSRASAADGDLEKAAKYKENAKMFASKSYSGNKTFYDQIWISLLTVSIGFLIATIVAVPVGVLCGVSPKFNTAMNPLIQLFKPVSPLAWFPIVFVITTWGIDTPPSDSIWQRALWTSAGVVMLCSLWPTLINTAVGVASVDKDHLNVAKVLKLGWFKRIWKIVLPASLPMIFTGLRLSIGVGWMVLIAADMMAQNQGLGKFVWDMYQNGDTMSTAQIIVAVFVIGGIGFFLDRIMLVFQRLVTFEDQNV
tara:strand:- start:179 stop:1417 length:1239 start_codon:yes stop_codon:yes gene_type:complete